MAKKGLCIIGAGFVNCRTYGQRADGGYDLTWCSFHYSAWIDYPNGTREEITSGFNAGGDEGVAVKIIRELPAGTKVCCSFTPYSTELGGYMVEGYVAGTAAYYN